MAHVFISFRRKDQVEVAAIADGLRLNELTVWWDDGLRGERADPAIKREMDAATSIVAVFSRDSDDSVWVEGERARAGAKLVPVLIDDVPLRDLPLFVQGFDFIDLRSWRSEGAQEEFRKLVLRCRAMRDGQKVEDVRAAPAPDGGKTRGSVPDRSPQIINNIGGSVNGLSSGANATFIFNGKPE